MVETDVGASFKCPLYQDVRINLALFTDVINCSELREKAVNGSINAALIKPAVVIESFQVLVAATKAYHLHNHNKKVTRSLNSEIIYSLSASKNISEAFRNNGIGDTDCSVLVVEIVEEGQMSQMPDVKAQIKGNIADVKNISNLSDIAKIKKIYKVKEAELACGTLTDAVVNRISSKDFVTFT